MDIHVKRAYSPASPSDGVRILVDRLWPRGLSKERIRMDMWAKDLAPSTTLREWFNHDPERWNEFNKRYAKELDAQPEAVKDILNRVRHGPVTLLFGAKDEQFNNAIALKAYLEKLAMRGKS